MQVSPPAVSAGSPVPTGSRARTPSAASPPSGAQVRLVRRVAALRRRNVDRVPIGSADPARKRRDDLAQMTERGDAQLAAAAQRRRLRATDVNEPGANAR